MEAGRGIDRQADAALAQSELARREQSANSAPTNGRCGLAPSIRFARSHATFPTLLAGPTFELLSTYMRENAPKYGGGEPPIDIREIIDTLTSHLVLK